MIYFLLVFAYVVSGKLGLMLALPPGYASPIFPPAGIAVAAALIGGRRTLPWIFLGSLALNILTTYSSSQQVGAIGIIAASSIAMASTLQAAAGGWCLRRTIGHPALLDCGNDIARFLLLTPVICLISASLSLNALLFLDILNADNFATNWVTWWVGDTLGVLVMLPLVLSVAGEPRTLWQNRVRTVAIPMLLIFALFVITYLKVNRWEYNDSLSEFRHLSQQVDHELQTRLEVQGTLLEQMAALFINETAGRITWEEFHRFTEKTLSKFPEIVAMEWAPRVDSESRTSFEEAQRSHFPNFEIRERNSAGEIRRAGKRTSFYPVTYVEPLVGNESILGLDLSSMSDRQKTITEAIKRETMVVTPLAHLIQGQMGVLLVMPVKHGGNESGIVLIALRLNDFMNTLLSRQTMINVRLLDLDESKTLHDNFAPGNQKALYKHDFNFGMRNYRLETAPTSAYLMQHQGWQSWGVLVAGILGTSLLGALLLLGTGYTSRVEATVKDRTRELKESEERLGRVTHGSSDIFWDWDVKADKVWWSTRFYEILGYAEKDIVTTYESFSTLLHPDDIEPVYKLINDHLANNTPYEIQYRLRTVSGDYRWFHAKGKVIREGRNPILFSGSSQDITERKNMEIELAASETKLRAIINASPVPLALNDEEQNITFLNPAFTEVFGYTLEDIPTLKDWWPKAYPDPNYRQWVMNTWQATLEKAKREDALFPPMELNIQCADGTVKTVMVSASTLEKSFSGTHLVTLFDITLRKQTEKKLMLYADELKRSNDALKDFAAIASHDLQEPLRKIISFGDRLRSTATLSEQGEDYLDRMQKATLRMQRFIHDLLEFSEFSSTPPQWNLVNLNEVVSGVIFDLENRIEKSQGTVEVGDLPSIETDRLQMRQLFQNMISNALKFRKPGIPPHVTVKSRPAGPGQWEIIIQDNGIGFNMQYFDRILKPFQRLHGRSAYEGSGIGLAVCQKVVENHGGEITAESSPGNGACFTVLLPEKQQLNG